MVCNIKTMTQNDTRKSVNVQRKHNMASTLTKGSKVNALKTEDKPSILDSWHF